MVQNLTPQEAQTRLSNDSNVILLDVREAWELASASIEGAMHIPMNQIPARISKFSNNDTIMVICHSGVRSLSVANYLIQAGFNDIWNVLGGTEAWAKTVDPALASY